MAAALGSRHTPGGRRPSSSQRESDLRARRYALVIVGSIVSAYGITLAIGAGFGGATLAVLWEGVDATLGVGLGWASLLVAAAMIGFVLLYDRRQIGVGTVVYQVVYGLCVGLFSGFHQYSGVPVLDGVLMVGGIGLFAVGTGLYAAADRGRGSYEAVTFALVERHGWSIGVVRVACDAAVVAVGALLGGSVGLCTLCAILLSGAVIQRTVACTKHFLL